MVKVLDTDAKVLGSILGNAMVHGVHPHSCMLQECGVSIGFISLNGLVGSPSNNVKTSQHEETSHIYKYSQQQQQRKVKANLPGTEVTSTCYYKDCGHTRTPQCTGLPRRWQTPSTASCRKHIADSTSHR